MTHVMREPDGSSSLFDVYVDPQQNWVRNFFQNVWRPLEFYMCKCGPNRSFGRHDPIPIIALLSTYLALQRSRLALIKSSNVFCKYVLLASSHKPTQCRRKLAPHGCTPNLFWISADQPWNMNGAKESWSCLEYVALLFGQHDLPALLYRPRKMRRQDSWSWSWKVIVLSKETENSVAHHMKCNPNTIHHSGMWTGLKKPERSCWSANWDFTWQICKNWMNCFHDLNDRLGPVIYCETTSGKLKNIPPTTCPNRQFQESV